MGKVLAGAVEMKVESGQGFGMKLSHEPSGVTLLTDAPRDMGGEASSFSPTDLLAASLASCMVTTMALVARREGVPWGPLHARIEKRMNAVPRRVGEVVVEIRMPRELPEAQRAHLEAVASDCPVAKSLHPDVQVSVRFLYGG